MTIAASIVISSFNRISLLRRTLWGIANRGLSVPYEVILVDDGSTDDILGELKLYSSCFPWKFIRFDRGLFEAETSLKKFLNNPCVTNNIGFKHAEGDFIYQQGNEVIPCEGCYDLLLADLPQGEFSMAFSTTYDVPPVLLDKLDCYGSNLSEDLVRATYEWPLQSIHYRSDVTNYISLATRSVWEALQGYDERYYGGIAAEDSDFVRRSRCLPGFESAISNDAVSLHQSHKGKTRYYNPPPSLITQSRWAEGCAINRAIYDRWDETAKNHQKWPWGILGVGEIITN